uniref:Ig-like domain-containing protein n=1 Tax=Sinocyclocheilus rhinocerous TaxID=307959 RepID=A0A673I9X7_9TELE
PSCWLKTQYLCSGQRLVQIQEGPLYRVKGYPIAISCNVTGFKGPAKQDFQFIVKKPNVDINMISTSSSVLLWIKHLLEEDAGDLLCETPNTDAVYFGNYTAETKLNVIADTLEACYSGSPSQSLSEGDPLQLEYQVSSQTFQHTHLSVTWFLHGEEDENPRPIITLDKDLTVKPGAGFEDHYRVGLISMDKVEDTTYRLKMPQVQQSDQGKFYCKAIEWIQDPDLSVHMTFCKRTCFVSHISSVSKVAPDVGSFSVYMKASKGPLQEGDALDIRCSVNAQNLPGHFFSVIWLKNQQKVAQIGSSGVLAIHSFHYECLHHKTLILPVLLPVWSESDLAVVMVMKDVVTEGDALRVTCLVSQFKGLLSVSWQHKKDSGDSFSDVISLTHEGVMKDIGARYQSRHVQTLHSPAGNFTLEIGASAKSDSGEYKCIVSEWIVQTNEDKLHVHKEEQSLNITSLQAGFTIDGVIESRYSDAAVFEVTWSRSQRNEQPVIIFNVSRDGTLHSGIVDKDLVFGHPSAMNYKLTVPNINPTDTGLYHCQFWRRIGEDKSGELSIHVDTKEKQKEDSFAMDRTDKNLDINEGDQFDLECSLDVGKEDPTHHYENQQLKDRLRFSRPTSDTFHLAVLNSDTADSGSYQCRVEQYQLDCKGQWKQTAHAQSGSTIVTVCSIGNTSIYISFTLSLLSAFEVTWFKVQEEEGPVTIFTARHDGILHSAISDKYLVFGRPSVTHYKLTVPQISPTDMGQYYCQVEEWLLTATIWKKLASDKSGELTIYVHTEDPLGITLGFTIPLICFLVLVIILLLRRENKMNSELKKKKDGLWAENNPLTPVPEVTSAAGDHS